MADEAQAVTEVARTADKIVDQTASAGSYLAVVLDDLPKDLVGIVGDRVRTIRAERQLANVFRLMKAAQAYTDVIDPKRLSEPSPSVIGPLLKAAGDEERSVLQDLWARLLANAATDGGKKVRAKVFETVKHLEPFDALVLQGFFELADEN